MSTPYDWDESDLCGPSTIAFLDRAWQNAKDLDTDTEREKDMTATRYILVRRLPTGEIKTHTTPFESVDRAARAAGLSLWNNGAEPVKSTAQRFSAKLAQQPLGTVWGHTSGYDFRILEADFTADGVEITPGLRVQNNDLRWGVICHNQFMDEGSLMPGGQYFDHWYYVLVDGQDRPISRFNGERLSAAGLGS